MSKTNERIEQAVWDCIRELYLSASPSVDIGDNAESLMLAIPGAATGNDPEWFDKYYIPREEYDEIVDRHIKNARFRGGNKRRFVGTLHMTSLYMGPSSKERK